MSGKKSNKKGAMIVALLSSRAIKAEAIAMQRTILNEKR